MKFLNSETNPPADKSENYWEVDAERIKIQLKYYGWN